MMKDPYAGWDAYCLGPMDQAQLNMARSTWRVWEANQRAFRMAGWMRLGAVAVGLAGLVALVVHPVAPRG